MANSGTYRIITMTPSRPGSPAAPLAPYPLPDETAPAFPEDRAEDCSLPEPSEEPPLPEPRYPLTDSERALVCSAVMAEARGETCSTYTAWFDYFKITILKYKAEHPGF